MLSEATDGYVILRATLLCLILYAAAFALRHADAAMLLHDIRHA